MDKALPRNSQTGYGQLAKMFITIEHMVYLDQTAYLFILTLSRQWYAKLVRGFAGHHFGQSRSF